MEKKAIVEQGEQIHNNSIKKSQTFEISACNNDHMYTTHAYYYAFLKGKKNG